MRRFIPKDCLYYYRQSFIYDYLTKYKNNEISRETILLHTGIGKVKLNKLMLYFNDYDPYFSEENLEATEKELLDFPDYTFEELSHNEKITYKILSKKFKE
jgi:hypothetical protein